MKKLGKISLIALAAVLGAFVVTFTMYIFNLDMKLLSKIEPILLKHYDKIPRNMRV